MHNLKRSLTDFLTAVLQSARTRQSLASAKSTGIAVAVLTIWLSVVISTVARHEFDRDEVRPLSLARAATSPVDLYTLTQYDGHPPLWFLILYLGNAITNSPLVLPVASVVIGFAAVALFVLVAPFPLWTKCLFIFGALPVYEYTIHARNYGISMLLMFTSAALYPNRRKYAFSLAVALALLAITNVHSALLACLITTLWLWDTFVTPSSSPPKTQSVVLYLPFVIVLAGGLLCAASTMPRENTILTSVRHGGTQDVTSSVIDSVLFPQVTFWGIVPEGFPESVSALTLYLAVLGLLPQPPLFVAALVGQIGFGVLFRVVYSGEYRHQGLFLIFMVTLYWIFTESLSEKTMARTWRALYTIGCCAMLVLILGDVAKTKGCVWTDLCMERSSNKALGEFLSGSEKYHDAIIVAEPDYFVESLPYYCANKIYLPREHRFGTTVSWTTESQPRLSVGELLSEAQRLKAKYSVPVLIVFGHFDIDHTQPGEKEYSYNKVLTWTTEEIEEFEKSLELVQEFSAAFTDENYRVYSVK